MTLRKVIGDFGGPYVDALPTEDPTSQVQADLYNRMAEDVAHLTRTSPAAVLRFASATAGPMTVDFYQSHWGSGGGFNPAITYTGTGVYTIDWSATYDDALGVTQNFSLAAGKATLDGHATVPGHANVKLVNGVQAIVYLRDSAHALSNLSGGRYITCEFWLS